MPTCLFLGLWAWGTLVSFTLKDKAIQVAKNTEKILRDPFINTLTCP
jgi:hypothetical protein